MTNVISEGGHGTPKPPKSHNFTGKTPTNGPSANLNGKINSKESAPKPVLNVKALNQSLKNDTNYAEYSHNGNMMENSGSYMNNT